VEVEPLGEATTEVFEAVWMFAALFRLEPKPKDLKRELMTSTSKRGVATGRASECGGSAAGAAVEAADLVRAGAGVRPTAPSVPVSG
jgi:hypothetical protein